MAPITFGILTISDTCYVDNSKDASGPEAERLVTNINTETGAVLKGKISCRDIIPDEESFIMKTLIKWSDKDNVNVILTTGGTGFSERDVTPEATKRVIEKEAPGISLAIFKKSLEVTPMAMLSRAVCGIRGKTLIINLPGSPKAVNECLTTVARVIPHAVALILGDKSKVTEDHRNITNNKSESSSKYRDLEIELSDVANRLRQSQYPMISLDEAVQIYRAVCQPFGVKEFVSVEEAHGRILATPVHSCCDLPPFRASIKDGYAVIAKDGKGSRRVLGGVEAGHTPGATKLISGTCVRVNTGAPIPDEATAVVQVEDTVHSSGSSTGKEETVIEILVAPTEGQDIRPVGCDIKKGALVLDVHTKIGPAELGVLAACGVTRVEVTKLPTVGILSTGNELQTAGEPAKPGHVYDSNKITLMATIKESGYSAVDFGIVRDDLQTMIAGIERALENVDVLITSGSVSMGDKDMLKPILKKVFGARIHFGRVALKPGKPTTFASCDYGGKKKYLLCLPGNPVSAMVTAHLFAIPVLHRLAGNYASPVEVLAELTADYKLDPRPEFARAVLLWEPNNPVPKAYITGNQISSKLLSCKTANALLVMPGKTAERPAVKSGDRVSARLLGFDINLVTVNQDKSSEINGFLFENSDSTETGSRAPGAQLFPIALQLKATLENIEELKPAGPEFSWCLKFTCSNCGEVSPKWNDVTLSEEFPEQHGKGVSHFVNKCKMCSRANSATIIADSVKPYGADDDGTFKSIVTFDCRGMEPSSFWPRDGWAAKAVDGGNTFSDVDLKDGDWADYCDKINQPVSIGEIEHKFVRVK